MSTEKASNGYDPFSSLFGDGGMEAYAKLGDSSNINERTDSTNFVGSSQAELDSAPMDA